VEAGLAASNKVLRYWRRLGLRPAFIVNLRYDGLLFEEVV